jgi:hypothetical protein
MSNAFVLDAALAAANRQLLQIGNELPSWRLGTD